MCISVKGPNLSGTLSGATIGEQPIGVILEEIDVRGVNIKYQIGHNLSERQLVVNADTCITLKPKSHINLTIRGVNIQSQGCDIWINGEKIDFTRN